MTSTATSVGLSQGTKERHPAGLYILFATELWERFGFYTAAAIMTLYLQRGGFNWTKDQATTLWSNYLMFIYATPLIGGFLADRYLGYRKSVLIGGAVFAVGYVLLGMGSQSVYYLALCALFVGNGFFKPNISTMVGNLYAPGSRLRDSAYNIFYMGINIGAFLAPVISEAILQWFVRPEIYEAAKKGATLAAADAASLRNGFLTAFLGAAIGMTFGTVLFSLFYKKMTGAERKPEPSDLGLDVAASEDVPPPQHEDAAVVPRPEIESIPEWKRIGALLVVFTIVIVFWMVFHQNGTTMTYWADEATDWKSSKVIPWIVWGLSLGTVDAKNASGVISNAINPFWIVVLSLPLVKFWGWLNRKGLEPSTPTKMAIGMVLTSVAFFILFTAASTGGNQTFQVDADGQYLLSKKGEFVITEHPVSPWWLITAYFVLSLGELMLSPMGLSLVSKVAPARVRGLMMGGWFVATAIGNKLTMIGVYYTKWQHSTFWLVLSGFALTMAVVLLVLIRPLKKAMPGV